MTKVEAILESPVGLAYLADDGQNKPILIFDGARYALFNGVKVSFVRDITIKVDQLEWLPAHNPKLANMMNSEQDQYYV